LGRKAVRKNGLSRGLPSKKITAAGKTPHVSTKGKGQPLLFGPAEKGDGRAGGNRQSENIN